jgi:hypothetical protein
MFESDRSDREDQDQRNLVKQTTTYGVWLTKISCRSQRESLYCFPKSVPNLLVKHISDSFLTKENDQQSSLNLYTLSHTTSEGGSFLFMDDVQRNCQETSTHDFEKAGLPDNIELSKKSSNTIRKSRRVTFSRRFLGHESHVLCAICLTERAFYHLLRERICNHQRHVGVHFLSSLSWFSSQGEKKNFTKEKSLPALIYSHYFIRLGRSNYVSIDTPGSYVRAWLTETKKERERE